MIWIVNYCYNQKEEMEFYSHEEELLVESDEAIIKPYLNDSGEVVLLAMIEPM